MPSVGGAVYVIIECLITNGRVVGAGCEIKKRIIALGSIEVGIASVRRWTDSAGRLAKAQKQTSVVDD